ncbi:hypothetical protein Sjap_012330 [Stephania japonica]|uniref:DUF4378 domain-containing protein n=1 Tax=Stephania japonica TaxID=461633 RepID=A0AAP0IVV3_9MAGN
MGSSPKYYLKQLLDQDQEPFVLQHYIAERRLQLILQKPKRNNNPISLCKKNACLSPEITTKSPLFHFSNGTTISSPQPLKSPFRPKATANADTFFIHVPSRTAALLLEAALRIQRQSKPKPQNGRRGFSILGSILGKFGHRRKTQNRRVRDSVKDKQQRRCDHNSSDRIEERFPDFGEVENEGFGCSSPFRIALVSRDESSEIFRSPELRSPATSPECRQKQVVQNEEVLQQGDHVLAKGCGEEKEHSSPVSVLDNPQFEDDDDDEESGEVHESENEDSDNGFELERSFAFVQRTKNRLLQKLRRFEQLAELDPVELEKRILEDEEEEEGEYSTDANDSSCSSAEDNSVAFAKEVLTCSSPCDCQRVSLDVRKLVLGLGDRENRALGFEGKDMIAKKLRGRLGSWRGTKMKAIDMMVELDLRREGQEWRETHEEDLQDISASIELDIFGFLVEELSDELVHDSSTCS